MNESRTRAADSSSRRFSSRRSFLKDVAGVAAGTVLTRQSLWAPGSSASAALAAAQPNLAIPKINPQFMITPDQAWDWNVFKA
jgi:UDP-3-O-[3-hydroxymyristoyl] glucosamine N-acyltransferase